MFARNDLVCLLMFCVLCAKPCISNCPFAVDLPDAILDEYTTKPYSFVGRHLCRQVVVIGFDGLKPNLQGTDIFVGRHLCRQVVVIGFDGLKPNLQGALLSLLPDNILLFI